MSGIFSTINVANKGMNAQQVSLNTASHNISNSTTEGYSRQRVELKADLAFTYGGIGQLGTGVKIAGVVRMIDDYVSRQIRQEGSILSQYNTKSQTLDQMEIIYNEPSETGLNFNIAEMFESWQSLANDPGNLTAKTIVVEKARTFADTLNQINGQLDSLNKETGKQIEQQILEINSIANNIESLNGQIFNVAIKGLIPNDLLDQRDKLLKDLSVMTDFDSRFDSYGRVEITIGDNDKEEGVAPDNVLVGIGLSDPEVSLKDEPDLDAKIAYLNNLTLKTTSGALKGYRDSQDLIKNQIGEEKDGKLGGLKGFAQQIAIAFNDVHKVAITDPPADPPETNYEFFTYNNSTGKLGVNQDLIDDNSKVLSGKSYLSPSGDNTTAKAILLIREASIGFSSGANTIEGAYNGIVTKVGIEKQHAGNMTTNQEVLVNQLQMRRESTSGVSLDEEFSNVVKYQKAFEANARVMSVLTDMLDVLINRTGL